MNRTISYLNADLDRSRQEGAKVMEVSLADMAELLSAAESGFAKQKAERPVKHAGWIKPGSLSMLRSGAKKFTRISRRRSDEFNTEVFFADDLKEKKLEAASSNVEKGEHP